jgi:aldose 1-epimerase
MRFSAAEMHRDGLQQLVLRDESAGTQVAILPRHGAMLHTFAITTASGVFNCIDNYANGTELELLLDKSFKSSKLSPFVCRIAAGKYLFNGEAYELHKKFADGSAIHGLLYNRAFDLLDAGGGDEAATATCSCVYNREDGGYPFTYRCTVSYRLTASNRLNIVTTVTNLSESPIPISDGWHPYFTVGGTADDWHLQIRSATLLEFDDRLLPTGKEIEDTRFLSPAVLRTMQLDNCFLLRPSVGDEVACTLSNPGNGVQLSIFASPSYPYLQVFIPPARRSIALENLSAAPDAFNNGMGLLLLQAGDSHSFETSFSLTS